MKEMTFGQAIEAAKKGNKIARKGWNGKGMWVCLIPTSNTMFKNYSMQDCLGMKTANNEMQPGWLANQSDMLSNDWVIVD